MQVSSQVAVVEVVLVTTDNAVIKKHRMLLVRKDNSVLNNKLNTPSLEVEEVAVVLAILAELVVLALTQTHREVMDLAVLKPLVEDLVQLVVAVVQLVEVKVVILDKTDKILVVTVELKDGVSKV